MFIFIEKKGNATLVKYGIKGNPTCILEVPVIKKKKPRPRTKLKSPNRFTNKALMADLFAFTRVNQKFTSRYEQMPTPSQPKNNKIKLFDAISNCIKNIKKQIYP